MEEREPPIDWMEAARGVGFLIVAVLSASVAFAALKLVAAYVLDLITKGP